MRPTRLDLSHGYITSSSLASKLAADLANAQTALSAGYDTIAKTWLTTFDDDVNAHKKNISAAYANLLVAWATDLSASL